MGDKVKVAIIGAGNISNSHIDGWQKSGLAEICGIVDIDITRAREKAEKWSCNCGTYSSIQALREDVQPDIMDICTPEHVHKEPALEALESGAAVFSEKILADSLSSGYAMVTRAREMGSWTAINYNYHFFPGVRALKEAIEDKRRGSLKILQCICHSFCFHHVLELLLWMCGQPISVESQGVQRDWSPEISRIFRIAPELIYIPGKAFTGRIEFENGVVCSITSSLYPSLSCLPFHFIAVFDSGEVMELSGLDWGKNMVGRCSWLPDGENLSIQPDVERTNQISFRGSIKSVAERWLAKLPPESSWEAGWDVMVLDHALLKAGQLEKRIQMAPFRRELEEKLEEGEGKC